MRLSNRASLIIKSVGILSAVFALGVQMAPTSYASSTILVGVYNGPGEVVGHDTFSNWLGSPVTYATDYIDYKGGWDMDFNPTWLIGPWSTWKSAQPGRKLVLGLPMLQNSNTGQFEQGATGAFDSYFVSLGSKMVATNLGDSIIRLGYEANCTTIGPWQATDNPSGYIKDFRHIVSVMRAIPGSNFKFDWTVCNGLTNGHALDSFASFYPGDDVVDIMGMDQYDVKWMDTSVTPEQRWQYNVSRYMGLQDHKNFAAAHAKPVSYPEWGLYRPGDQFAGGGDNPYFIDQMADWIVASNAAYQSYFNLNWGGGVLADFPKGQAEFKARFGQTVTNDTTVPTVKLTLPVSGSVFNGKLNITASATDNVLVTRMEVYVNDSLKKSVSGPSVNYGWDPKKAGQYTITVKAYDAAGNSGSATADVVRN